MLRFDMPGAFDVGLVVMRMLFLLTGGNRIDTMGSDCYILSIQ